jgi:UDP-N-acetylglucosamine/UDP-N-acetylgalactosamine diphosphorylase
MTSPLNYAQTVDILKKNDYYGLSSDSVKIFQQGTLPNFSFDGKILMSDKHKVACSPDGHGGSLKALFDQGALGHMKQLGVECISYWQVDNPLVNVLDPLFIGLHSLKKAQISSKAINKAGPFEKVGNFCQVDGKITVVEYIDLPDDIAEETREDGSLLFGLGSIGIHIFDRGFVEQLNKNGFSLPLHRAVKKIPFVNEAGEYITPSESNGVKLETFVFDALTLASKSIILKTDRVEEFGPVKNLTGADSAQTSREMLINRAALWLERAGVVVPRTENGAVACTLEISADFALSSEDIKGKLNDIAPIKSGDSLYLD